MRFPPPVLLSVLLATAATGARAAAGDSSPPRGRRDTVVAKDGRPHRPDDEDGGSSFDDSSFDGYSFDDFALKYGKVYQSAEERRRRREIFEQNLATIRNHNDRHRNNHDKDETGQLRSPGYTLGVNQFADLRLDEELPTGWDKSSHPAYRRATQNDNSVSSTNNGVVVDVASNDPSVSRLPWQPQWGGLQSTSLDGRYLRHPHIRHPPNSNAANEGVPVGWPSRTELPPSVDWRTHRRSGGGDGPPSGAAVTTPVKNQGHCGSCWAFAATAALESHVAIETGALFVLSVQELVSCVPNARECGGGGGCDGATAELAFDYVARHGMVDEWAFGYQSYHGTGVNCSIMPPGNETASKATIPGAVASIVGFANLPTNSYNTLMMAVATLGPVVVNVAATGWGLYRGGIFDDDDEPHRDLNHAVVLEGYGTDGETGQDFWLVRNSWGPLWGEGGYIRLKRVDPATLADPRADCKVDVRPADGVACKRDDGGNDVIPPAVEVCGTSGILFDGVVPIGGHLL